MNYEDFRTGLTFAAVAEMLRQEARVKFETTGERMFITRSTVLGRWHQIKRESFAAYKRYGGSNDDAHKAGSAYA